MTTDETDSGQGVAGPRDLPAPGDAAPSGEVGGQIRLLSKARILPYLASTMLLGAAFLVFLVYRSYAWPVFIAMLFYVGFDGLNRRLRVILWKSPAAAASATMAIVVVAVLGPIALLVRHLFRELIGLIRGVQAFIAGDRLFELALLFPGLTDSITEEPFFWTSLADNYRRYLSEFGGLFESARLGAWLGNAYGVVTSGLSVTAGLAVNLLFALIILFFLFRDGPSFYAFLEEALPFPKLLTQRFVSRMRTLIRAVLFGNVFVSILQGAAVGMGLSICGIQNSIVYGVLAGIFSLIPIIGTSIVWLPAVIYLIFAEQSYGYALFLSIWGVFFYLFLENIVKPKILDRRLGVHPLLLFLAILGGIAEFGPTGVILGPLIVTMFMTVWSIYHIWGGSLPDLLPKTPAGVAVESHAAAAGSGLPPAEPSS